MKLSLSPALLLLAFLLSATIPVASGFSSFADSLGGNGNKNKGKAKPASYGPSSGVPGKPSAPAFGAGYLDQVSSGSAIPAAAVTASNAAAAVPAPAAAALAVPSTPPQQQQSSTTTTDNTHVVLDAINDLGTSMSTGTKAQIDVLLEISASFRLLAEKTAAKNAAAAMAVPSGTGAPPGTPWQ